jgi:hypothetical protein
MKMAQIEKTVDTQEPRFNHPYRLSKLLVEIKIENQL